MTHSIVLNGLDGCNPLAFLAALGTLRSLTLALSDEDIRMSWQQSTGAWHPVISTQTNYADGQFIQILHDQLKLATTRVAFSIGDNLNLKSDEFAKCLAEAMVTFRGNQKRDDLDFLAAFGCESCSNSDETMEDTGLRTMSGGGHQHFLKFFRDLITTTDTSHLHRSLLKVWDYADDGRGLNLRWDPHDDRRYALRWDDPSSDPIKTMRGANRLAIEALPLLPTIPTSVGLATTCFQGTNARNTFFVYPIWNSPLTLDTVRSVLGNTFHFKELTSNDRTTIGIVQIFSSQRMNPTPKYRNFTPAQPV